MPTTLNAQQQGLLDVCLKHFSEIAANNKPKTSVNAF